MKQPTSDILPDAEQNYPTDGPVLSIIVVSYNTRELTLDCLRSVFDQTTQTQFELLVVDNASSDGSAEAVAAEFPTARLWPLKENLGFAAANNFAARHAAGEWLLLLNPDTVVLDGAIDKLVGFAAREAGVDPNNGIFGGRTLFADGTLNPTSCWSRPTLWSTFCLASGLTNLFRGSALLNREAMPAWKRDSVRPLDIVTGCFFLLRRELWERLGGFDPAFFMYGEEADLCLRARQSGIRGLINPDATIVHYGGASERVRAEKMVRLFTAKAQLFRRHWSPGKAAAGVLLLDLWAVSRLLAFSVATPFRLHFREQLETWRSVWAGRGRWHAASLQPAGAVPGEPKLTA